MFPAVLLTFIGTYFVIKGQEGVSSYDDLLSGYDEAHSYRKPERMAFLFFVVLVFYHMVMVREYFKYLNANKAVIKMAVICIVLSLVSMVILIALVILIFYPMMSPYVDGLQALYFVVVMGGTTNVTRMMIFRRDTTKEQEAHRTASL